MSHGCVSSSHIEGSRGQYYWNSKKVVSASTSISGNANVIRVNSITYAFVFNFKPGHCENIFNCKSSDDSTGGGDGDDDD